MHFGIFLFWFVGLIFFASAQNEGCPSVCPAVYRPVCGRVAGTLRTFSNQCEMNKFNCVARPGATFVRRGAC
ncbi:vasotab-like [Hermetia illucens]|uniref:vasotab-like n=1 Tax=Hermetia illucens TaxID=343691 RepID=UPI0018CC530F|nr:vasotab-like [Hermetia illucens]